MARVGDWLHRKAVYSRQQDPQCFAPVDRGRPLVQRRMVLLVHSDDFGWTELRRILESMENVEVVGGAVTPRAAIRLAERLAPDVVISAPHVDGEPTLSMLVELRGHIVPSSKIIVIARRLDPETLLDLAELGIAGHLLWSDLSPGTLRHCLAVVILDDIVVASRGIADAFLEARRGSPRDDITTVHLSDRELALLQKTRRGPHPRADRPSRARQPPHGRAARLAGGSQT